MKKINVLFIEFLEITAANHLLMMIKGLHRRSDVNLVTLCRHNSYLSNQLKSQRIGTVIETPYVELNLHSPSTYLKFLYYQLLIIRTIFKHKINIIHVHRLNWAYLAIIPSILFRLPLIVHIVIIEPLTSKFQSLLIRILGAGIHYIAVSQDSLEKFRSQNPRIRSSHLHYHYGGIFFPDISESQKQPIKALEKISQKSSHIIGMVSRVDPLKGIDVFIEAAAIIHSKYPNIHFVHIGHPPKMNFEDPYISSCVHRLANLKLYPYFTFMPYSADVLSAYRYFFLTVLPTSKDTLAYVNVESQANQVPIIYTDVEGVPETTFPENPGAIPHPPSPFIIAQKIESFLVSPNLYRRVQKSGSKYVAHTFDSTKNASKLVKLYRSLL